MATIQIISVVQPDWCNYSYICMGTAYASVQGSDNAV